MIEESTRPTGVTRVGVDIGGTFTDVAAVNREGRLMIGKRLTTHGAEQEGVLQAISDTQVDRSAAGTILAHGTTLVINSLLERRGCRVALVTTRGFGDLLDIGRGNRGEIFTLRYRRPEPIVPRSMRFEIDERTFADGTVGHAPTADELDNLVRRLSDAGVEAVAVGFLHAYVNAETERLVSAHLSQALPAVPICISSEFSRQWREFERFTTAAANAYVAPVVERYLDRLTSGLGEDGTRGNFVVLDSSGGAMTVDTARAFPVRAVESGPVAGVIGARQLAHDLGIDNLVSLDMGGTTAKSALIANGDFATKDLYWIGGEAYGFPLQVGTVDIIEVGIGGGSIAWLDPSGRLRVGPRSAGSSPGPACYGLGGTEATLTDANLFCGRIDATHFSPSFHLDVDAAVGAIERLAAEAQMSPERLAMGIIRLATMEVAANVRRQTLERGNDPREYTLLASGGAGPMHVCAVAKEVGIWRVLVPRFPGHYSALGMLKANLRLEHQEVFLGLLPRLEPEVLRTSLVAAAERVTARLRFGDQAPAGDIRYSYELALRFRGQEHALWISAPSLGIDVPDDIADYLSAAFRAEYLRRYGHVDDGIEVETVELRLVGERILPSVSVEYDEADDGESATVMSIWDDTQSRVETPIVSRASLTSGARLAGPAIIRETGSTTVVPPDTTVEVLDEGAMAITVT
jgi:N-methylhydantoinase A